MKNKLKFFRRRFKNLLFGFTGTAIHCSKCKSLNVAFGKSKFEDGVESYVVVCRDCEAFAVITEKWFEKEERKEKQYE